MSRTCVAQGCSESAAGYSTLCRQHKQAQRRHGSPIQHAVTSQELGPYVALVEARKSKNPKSEAWAILESRWATVGEVSRSTLQRYAEGQASQRYAVQAAKLIRNVGENVEAWTVVKVALAMFILQDQQPRRFTSDEAFDFQLVRRVLRLAPVNAGKYWNQRDGKVKKVYRDVPPRTIRTIATLLKETFGGPGLTLAAKEREEAEKGADERRRLANALGDML
jgi:hypothetical protein